MCQCVKGHTFHLIESKELYKIYKEYLIRDIGITKKELIKDFKEQFSNLNDVVKKGISSYLIIGTYFILYLLKGY